MLDEDEDIDAAEARTAVAELAPNTLIGPFRIVRLLGTGGMAAVYEAHEAPLGREVALKVLPPQFLHGETFVTGFTREAHNHASLEHPSIVPIYASGIDAGIPWISMRLLTGGTLSTLLVAGSLGIERTARILRSVADALDYAHARGFVHRDVKPSNILLDQAGRAYLSDFGLARLVEEGGGRTTRTALAGTPHYMAPERILPQAARTPPGTAAKSSRADPGCDIYSLGVVAYEMLTGTTPFHGDSPVAVLMQHVKDPVPAPAQTLVPAPVFVVLKRALAKDPADRWPTAGAFVTALETAIAAPVMQRPVRPISPRVAAAVAAISLTTALVALLWPAGGRVPRPPSSGRIVPVTDSSLPRDSSPASDSSPPAPPIPAAGPEATAGRASGSEALVPARRPRAASRSPGVPLVDGAPLAAPSPSTISAEVDPPPESPGGGSRRVESAPAVSPEAAPTPVSPERPVVEDRAQVAAAPPAAAPTSTPPPSDVVTQPVLVFTVRPTYPPLARAAQIQGDVELEAVVGPDGRVSEVRILRSAHPVLDQAARSAVLQYRYTPGLRNGVPDTFTVQTTVRFQLK